MVLLSSLKFLLTLLISSAAVAEPKGNAGVIPYSCQGGQALVLLAYDPYYKRRGWGAFGGSNKLGETIDETASREFYEETNCAFDKLKLRDKPYSQSKNYYTFFAQVDYQAAFTISARQSSCNNVERHSWLWVQHRDLLIALDSNEDINVANDDEHGDTIHLWSGARRSLQQALNDGVLLRHIDCL
jgi:8-oxo-dGTP pyrophosphatase MutT (NUDIX family)